MINLLLDKMKKGEKTIGTFFMQGNSTMAECIGYSGLDYLIIDTEHGSFDVETTLDIIGRSEARNITALARVKDSSRPSILKMLDIGVKGLVIPQVRSVEEVRKIVEYGKYYPMGQRGLAFARGAGFGHADFAKDFGGYLKTCNEQTMLIPQCETKECLDNIEEIVAIEGVSGIFVGPFDLSVALNKPAQFGTPEFAAALERILTACKNAKKYCFIFSMDSQGANKYFDQGFDSVAISNEADVLINSFKKLVSEVKI
ncbi:MAG: HpcH/HpaI aldolase/citrate lyase family protein [Clostridiaceae bacterium]